MPATTPESWTSLEIVKLAASTLTPIALAIFGFWLNRYLKRIEHFQWASQKAVEKRLDVYSKLAPLLNDLYCYFDYIGEWKWKPPTDALALKRSIDREFYVNAPLFSRQFRENYEAFIDLYFVPGPLNEYDASAKLRTDISHRKKLITKTEISWEEDWNQYFCAPEVATNREDVVASYWKLMNAFAIELGVELNQKS